MDKETEIKMVLKCECPHCGEAIVMKLDVPTPIITGVLKPGDVDENIKRLIDEEKHDTSEEPKTA